MTNTNYHPNMNDDTDNNIIQTTYAVSQVVTEVPYKLAIQIMDRQINHRIAFKKNQQNVAFGQSVPWHADRQRIVNIRHLIKTIKCLAIGVLILIIGALFVSILLRYIYRGPPLDIEEIPAHDTPMSLALYDNHQDFIMKEEDDCFCGNVIGENNLDVIINNGIIDQITYNEIVDNSTCALYDLFLFVFNKLCCLKDNIIAIIPTDYDENSLDTYDKTGASKIEQNGVIMSPTNSSEEFVEK